MVHQGMVGAAIFRAIRKINLEMVDFTSTANVMLLSYTGMLNRGWFYLRRKSSASENAESHHFLKA